MLLHLKNMLNTRLLTSGNHKLIYLYMILKIADGGKNKIYEAKFN